jgi:hypothetical protein
MAANTKLTIQIGAEERTAAAAIDAITKRLDGMTKPQADRRPSRHYGGCHK